VTVPLHTAERQAESLAVLPVSGEGIAGTGLAAARVRRNAKFGVVFWVSVTWLALIVFLAVFASLLPIPSPDALDPFRRLQGLGTNGHLLGTDDLGRDVLSRLVYGARVSLIVGAASFGFGLIVGGALGMVGGFVGGWLERLITWVMDVLLSFPALVLLIALVAYVGHSLFDISMALGFLGIPVFARLARATTLALAERDFVKAARGAGLSPARILRREVLPNVFPGLFAYGLIAMGVAIVVEGSLSFLGLSVSAPTPSWGGLIAEGQNFLHNDPALVLIPSIVLCLTVLALNLAGDTLRRAAGDGRGTL
jgi:peptide/nickel transport system permease protein